jgi:hypothetical protein
MRWRVTTHMEERARFVRNLDSELFNFPERCQRSCAARWMAYK